MTKNRNTVNGYSDHIVAFIDVLGFSDAIRKSATSPDNYDKVSGLLAKFKELAIEKTKETHGRKIPPINISSYSDSIIVWCPIISDLSFNIVLLVISEFCLRAATECGFFLRGALTIGPFQENDGTMFGPALVRAYEIEQSLVLWPRCVIDPNSLSYSNIYPDGDWNKHHYIMLGSDGLPFLDYLGFPIAKYFYSWLEHRTKSASQKQEDNPEDIALKVLHYHKLAICKAVQNTGNNEEQAKSLFTKYYPLAVYHNRVIGRFALDRSLPERLDDIKRFASEKGFDPTIIDRLDPNIVDARVRRWRSELIDLGSIFNLMWSNRFTPNDSKLNNL